MINAAWQAVTALLALLIFGGIAWLYQAFGRLYVGLNGNMEIVVIGVALYAVREQLVSVSTNVIGAVRKAAAQK